jgi:hypothetical protein
MLASTVYPVLVSSAQGAEGICGKAAGGVRAGEETGRQCGHKEPREGPRSV